MDVAAVAERAAARRRESVARLRPVAVGARRQAEALIANRLEAKDRLAILEREFTVKIGGHGDFWPTPWPLARRMVEMAGIAPGMRVLEPSAGTGRIADAIRQVGIEPVCVEFYQSCHDILVEKGYTVAYQDFASYTVDGYGVIVMNPPFAHDVDHVRHAYSLLAVGGVLVAIMSEHSFFSQHKHDREFRAWFDEIGGESEQLRDAFVGSGTGVAVRLCKVVKRV